MMEMCDSEEKFARIYFEPDEWNKLSAYEKTRYVNVKRNFEVLKSTGLNPKMLQFMNPQRKLEKPTPIKSSVEDTKQIEAINDKMRRSKSLPGDLNKARKRWNHLAQEEVISKFMQVDWKNRFTELSPKIRKGVSVLLESAQKYLCYLDNLKVKESFEIPTKKPQPSPDAKKKYPKRNVPIVCYTEEEIPSEDDFLYCDDCGRANEGDCLVHGPMIFVPDRKVKPGSGSDHAKETCPPFLSVSYSGIKEAGLGIWTEIKLPKGVVFGPYRGTIVKKHRDVERTGYAWQVRKDGRVHHYIEGSDTSVANWLRFVNCADCEEHQNLVAFQYKGKIYYRTYKEVMRHTELLVWYGDGYAKDLEIDLRRREKEQSDEEQAVVNVNFECDKCHALFATEDYLIRHKKRHPHQGHDRKHACPHCPYSVTRASHLKRHLLTHTGEKPHQCPECDRRFSQKRNLKKHLLVHSGERPFQCRDCWRSFTETSDLRRHERTHSGFRPYVCATCGRQFSEMGNLRTHELLHPGQGSHKCQHCEYRAPNAGRMRYHAIQVHTREFSHVCSACDNRFLSTEELRRHVESKHGNDEPRLTKSH